MAKTGSNRGWGDLYGEQVNPNYNADYKEIFDNGLELEKKDPLSKLSVYAKNNWPAEPENFSKIILSYYEDSIKLSKSILKNISKIIDRDQNYFDDKFEKPMALLRGKMLKLAWKKNKKKKKKKAKIDPEISERAAVLANMKKQIATAKVNAQRAATIEAQNQIETTQ